MHAALTLDSELTAFGLGVQMAAEACSEGRAGRGRRPGGNGRVSPKDALHANLKREEGPFDGYHFGGFMSTNHFSGSIKSRSPVLLVCLRNMGMNIPASHKKARVVRGVLAKLSKIFSDTMNTHRCPFWLVGLKHRGRFLVCLMVESSTWEIHLFSKKDTYVNIL